MIDLPPQDAMSSADKWIAWWRSLTPQQRINENLKAGAQFKTIFMQADLSEIEVRLVASKS